MSNLIAPRFTILDIRVVRQLIYNFLFCFACVLVAGQSYAQSGTIAVQPEERVWAIKAGSVTLMTFSLSLHDDKWVAIWRQPMSYNLVDEHISGVKGPPVSRVARTVQFLGHKVRMTFASPFPNGADDEFVISGDGHGDATLEWNAYNGVTFLLEDRAAQAFGYGWSDGDSYTLLVRRPVNSELTSMYSNDQSARVEPSKIDWTALRLADAKRRERVQQLLNEKKLSAGIDYYHAAYIFQHGYSPDDYLKAHVLALIAMARGYNAAWIAAATLDRYLQSAGHPQVLGTQFKQEANKAYTQEPFDRSLLSDAERQAVHVPVLADQEKERQALSSSK